MIGNVFEIPLEYQKYLQNDSFQDILNKLCVCAAAIDHQVLMADRIGYEKMVVTKLLQASIVLNSSGSLPVKRDERLLPVLDVARNMDSCLDQRYYEMERELDAELAKLRLLEETCKCFQKAFETFHEQLSQSRETKDANLLLALAFKQCAVIIGQILSPDDLPSSLFDYMDKLYQQTPELFVDQAVKRKHKSVESPDVFQSPSESASISRSQLTSSSSQTSKRIKVMGILAPESSQPHPKSQESGELQNPQTIFNSIESYTPFQSQDSRFNSLTNSESQICGSVVELKSQQSQINSGFDSDLKILNVNSEFQDSLFNSRICSTPRESLSHSKSVQNLYPIISPAKTSSENSGKILSLNGSTSHTSVTSSLNCRKANVDFISSANAGASQVFLPPIRLRLSPGPQSLVEEIHSNLSPSPIGQVDENMIKFSKVSADIVAQSDTVIKTVHIFNENQDADNEIAILRLQSKEICPHNSPQSRANYSQGSVSTSVSLTPSSLLSLQELDQFFVQDSQPEDSQPGYAVQSQDPLISAINNSI